MRVYILLINYVFVFSLLKVFFKILYKKNQVSNTMQNTFMYVFFLNALLKNKTSSNVDTLQDNYIINIRRMRRSRTLNVMVENLNRKLVGRHFLRHVINRI